MNKLLIGLNLRLVITRVDPNLVTHFNAPDTYATLIDLSTV